MSIAIVTGGISLIGLLAALIAESILWFLFSLFVIFVGVVGVARIFLAKGHAFRLHLEEVDVFPGLVKLILWMPTDGVIFMKNRKLTYIDQNLNDGGGITLLYPVLGEEVALRAPLTVRAVAFDCTVVTRDYIELHIKLTLWWRLQNLAPYYLLVSRRFMLRTTRGSTSSRDEAARRVNWKQPSGGLN
jgi:hypothetical protein